MLHARCKGTEKLWSDRCALNKNRATGFGLNGLCVTLSENGPERLMIWRGLSHSWNSRWQLYRCRRSFSGLWYYFRPRFNNHWARSRECSGWLGIDQWLVDNYCPLLKIMNWPYSFNWVRVLHMRGRLLMSNSNKCPWRVCIRNELWFVYLSCCLLWNPYSCVKELWREVLYWLTVHLHWNWFVLYLDVRGITSFFSVAWWHMIC